MSAKSVQWKGRPVADAAAVPDLDVSAAIHQFGGGVTRGEAEERAYGEYRKRQATEAAAHHLRLYRAATSAGDREVANRHKLIYDVHVRTLGENPAGQPPQQVKALVGDGAEPATRFKPHPADSLPLTKALPWGDHTEEDDGLGGAAKQGAFRAWRDRVGTVREQSFFEREQQRRAAEKPMAVAPEAGNRFAALDLRPVRDVKYTVPWAPDNLTSPSRRQKLFRQWREDQVGPDPPSKHARGCRKGRCEGECHAPDTVMCVGRYGTKQASTRVGLVPIWAAKMYQKQQRADGAWTYRLRDMAKGTSGRQPSDVFIKKVREAAAAANVPYVYVNHGDMPAKFKKFPHPHIDPSPHLEGGRFSKLEID